MNVPEPTTEPVESPDATAIPPDVSTGGPPRPVRVWALAMVGAVVAGVGPFLIGEAHPPSYKPETEKVRMMGQLVDQATPAGLAAVERKTAILSFGVVGGCLGLALGLAGGLARGSIRSALMAMTAGLLLGAAAGAGGSAAIVPVFHRELARMNTGEPKSLVLPLLLQSATWATIGVAAGLALGIGAGPGRRVPSAAFGGLVGGALAGAVYTVAAALLAPDGRTDQPVAGTWTPRLLAATIGPILVAALAAFALLDRPRRPKAKATTGPADAGRGA